MTFCASASSTPPNSKGSEMMILGCMLTNVRALNIAVERLSSQDFYYNEHQLIFQVLKESISSADIHLVAEELRRREQLKIIGGVGYLATLAQYAGTSAAIEEYVRLVRNKTLLRRVISEIQVLERQALDEPADVESFCQSGLDHLKAIIQGHHHIEGSIQFLNEFDQNFLLVDPPNKPMLLEYANENGVPLGFLPKGIVAMLVGAGGVGKTHILAQLAIAIASGTPFLRTFTTTKYCGEGNRGNVFFGLGENHYDDIHRVLHKSAKKLRETQPDLLKEAVSKRIAPFSFCGQQASFIKNQEPSSYFRSMKRLLIDRAPIDGWALIILDPVSRLLGADAETDNAAATQFIALLEDLTMDLPGNPTILFAHHVNKAALQQGKALDQSAARGSSALTDGVRLQFSLAKQAVASQIVLGMSKSNFTAIHKGIILQKGFEGFLEPFNGTLASKEKQSKSASGSHFLDVN